MPDASYRGYTSYSYLTPADDYEVFDLDDEIDRVPGHDPGLTEAQAGRAGRLLRDSVVISLHDHPVIFPRDITQVRDYIRTGRQHTGYQGLSRSGLTAVFDNLMDGTGCVTSKSAWKWDDTIYDLGMRLCDIAHQDYVRVARTVPEITAAHDTGHLAIVLGMEAATPIENEVDRLDILYGLGIRQIGIAYSESNSLGSGLKEAGDGGLTAFGRRAVERMNKLGLAIDVSHSSDRTCLDTFEASSKPVFITHAGARAVWPTPRMKPDEVLVACATRRRGDRHRGRAAHHLVGGPPAALDRVRHGPLRVLRRSPRDRARGLRAGHACTAIMSASTGNSRPSSGCTRWLRPRSTRCPMSPGWRTRQRISATSSAGWSSTATRMPISRRSSAGTCSGC